MQEKVTSCFKRVIVVFALFFIAVFELSAGVTTLGSKGFLNVPSHRTVKKGEIEAAFRYQYLRIPDSASTYKQNLALVFSPVYDFELGISKAFVSDYEKEPDPVLSFKARIPSLGEDYLSDIAVGMVLDTNPDNYHTAYIMFGGFGVGYNFGGNRFSGVANYGRYNHDRNEPESFCILIAMQTPERTPGQRGYLSQYFFEFNGDVMSAGLRYSTHRGFSAELAVSGKGSYNDIHGHTPVSVAISARF